MIVEHFDHVTVCVSDLKAAKRFFGLLGLKEDKSVVISGEGFATYMGLDEIEADPGATRRLAPVLHYRRPEAARDPHCEARQAGFQSHLLCGRGYRSYVEDLRSKGSKCAANSKNSTIASYSF